MILFENRDIVLEQLPNGDYRITMFDKDNHWAGDFAFNKESGIVWDDLTLKDD